MEPTVRGKKNKNRCHKNLKSCDLFPHNNEIFPGDAGDGLLIVQRGFGEQRRGRRDGGTRRHRGRQRHPSHHVSWPNSNPLVFVATNARVDDVGGSVSLSLGLFQYFLFFLLVHTCACVVLQARPAKQQRRVIRRTERGLP